MATTLESGAFMEKFVLQPNSSSQQLPLSGLTFAVKELFDVGGYVTGFGNPDWKRTHSAAVSTAPAVLSVLEGGATCVGKTVMDEMAYRVPGGSSSGSAVAVGAGLVDFSLGTDMGGSVRVPASYCGILGFRPSHDAISTSGVPEFRYCPASLEVFRARAFSLLWVAGVAGFCQVSIPLGMYNNLPVSISLVAKHGSDGFLLNLVENLYDTIQQEAGFAQRITN
ncbi:TRANSLOCON AT THE OUTER MEMBRANE OF CHLOROPLASTS 64-I, AMIDASE-LIKE PROTEIN 1, amidase 1 [Hibiscus trionum]|uniref:TRANSLOCON AT THE OUTER MEMBRANE OF CHLOROPLASTS 64-I, AMIDASE-LIKE PROTEIN 1, amidase 1 n=1 Tax=Hibiscus trionum TaxID=183268 RepID=A0A9W7HK94_HIBTR|nr:TRANSLOCON AT THE OUTER MEMBRANE OF CHLOROPLASTS 64-I, AMIDASE-LIKE PROTEIN 1, amidase 1 [Hibiscus trionum]